MDYKGCYTLSQYHKKKSESNFGKQKQKKSRFRMEAALFYSPDLIFVIVACDLFEQIVGVVVGQIGVVQIIRTRFGIVV